MIEKGIIIEELTLWAGKVIIVGIAVMIMGYSYLYITVNFFISQLPTLCPMIKESSLIPTSLLPIVK